MPKIQTNAVIYRTLRKLCKEGIILKKSLAKQFKHILSYIAAMSITVSSFYVLSAVTAKSENSVWGGDKTKEISNLQGSGTEDEPYLISDGAELYAAVAGSNNAKESKYFSITNDIYLNSVENDEYKNWDKAAPANKWTEKEIHFTGVIDGNGYTVYGLYVNKGGLSGFVDQLNGPSSIKNLNIRKSCIVGGNYTGAFAGYMSYGGAVISGCTAAEVKVTSTGCAAGGIAGRMEANAVISDSACYDAELSSGGNNERSGGIAGNGWKYKNNKLNEQRSITNCFSAGYVPVGTLNNIGWFKLTNVYSDKASVSGVTVLKNSEMQGSDAVKTMKLSESIWLATAGYPVIRVRTEDGIWNGNKSKKITDLKGNGTESDPYLISNGSELYAAVAGSHNASEIKYFSITNDIYLNSVENDEYKNWSASNAPVNTWTSGSIHFKGVLNGNGHTIYGLYVNKDGLSGFVDQLDGPSSIKNLNIRKSCVIGTSYTGVFAGYMYTGDNKNNCVPSVISGCTAADVKVISANNAVGGIVGRMGKKAAVTESACYNASFSSNEGMGGIAGNGWNGPMYISNCFSAGYAPVGSSVNAVQFTYSNVYSDKASVSGVTVLDNSKMQGSDAVKTMKLSENIWLSTVTYPIIKESYNGVKGEVWSGKNASTFAGGDGTAANPYLIETGEQLYKMVSEHSVASDPEPGAYYELTADIKLNDISSDEWKNKSESLNEWYTSEYTSAGQGFAGHFNGNGHFVYGLYAVNTRYVTALVPTIGKNASIRNVHLRDSYIRGRYDGSASYIGGITAFVTSGATAEIVACSVKDTVFDTALSVGGIACEIASGFLSIESCYSVVDVIGEKDFAGGIYSDCWGTAAVSDSYCIGNVMIDRSTNGNSYVKYSTKSQSESNDAKGIAVTVIPEDVKGDAAKQFMPGLDWKNSWYTVDGDYPHVKVSDYNNGEKGKIWSGKKATEYAGGSGTESDPYLIETGEQLYKMVFEHTVKNDKAAYYKLTADIKLNDTSKEKWYSGENVNRWFVSEVYDYSFAGRFDGDGHTVSGVYTESEANPSYASLIPSIGKSAAVKNVGVTNSYISVSKSISDNYAAAIVAYIQNWDEKNPVTEANTPVISNCFADSTVNVSGLITGGIVGGIPAPVRIEDTYFLGNLDWSDIGGSIIANIWTTGTNVVRCYAATSKMGDFSGGRSASQGTVGYEACYNFGTGAGSGLNFVSLYDMRGEKSKESMPAFDFDNVWKTVKGGTPVLRVFGKRAEEFSSTEDYYSTVTFVSNVKEMSIPSSTGIIDSHLDLPKPERYGYRFAGWYVYSELQCEYKYDTYPLIDLTLYAKWEPLGIKQDFESFPNTEYDMADDYVYYRPGAAGYDANNVHGGLKSLKRKGNSSEKQDFLVKYEEELVPGHEYVMKFWMMTENSGASGTVSVLNATWPDIAEPIKGINTSVGYKNLKAGEWKEYTIKFKAVTPWISLRTDGNTTLYFDDFIIIDSKNIK